jgi:hypothetical protein
MVGAAMGRLAKAGPAIKLNLWAVMEPGAGGVHQNDYDAGIKSGS